MKECDIFRGQNIPYIFSGGHDSNPRIYASGKGVKLTNHTLLIFSFKFRFLSAFTPCTVIEVQILTVIDHNPDHGCGLIRITDYAIPDIDIRGFRGCVFNFMDG